MLNKLRAFYHYLWALASALWYRFPSRQLYVVAVTGTKGKSTTVELVNAILENAGYKTALSSTVRVKIGDDSQPNLKKMSMPGRGWMQKWLRQAVRAGCTHAIVEMTSEGAKQFRHKFIDLDALIFTNLAPEHIESHGSYEQYRDAKLSIARALERSPKPNRLIVVNADDKEAGKFLAVNVSRKIIFSLSQLPSYARETNLIGDFNKYNILAASAFAKAIGISEEIIARAVKNFHGVRGRMEEVAGAPFKIIVDYAHTPDSLEAVYKAFKDQRKICVLGGTGGGRDKWKRPLMGEIAATYCDQIFLTDEDPYDENPEQIVREVASGIKDPTKYKVIMDRRVAIATALRHAAKLASSTPLGTSQGSHKNVVVLVTGKGTDPYIMGPHGTKTPWDDVKVAREELLKLKN